MGTSGATFVRFGFGVPFALLYWAVLIFGFGYDLPGLSLVFAIWLIVAAAAQIGATFLLVHLFSLRNFAVGNAYSRTEPVQTAVFAFVLFGVQFSVSAVLSIVFAVIGLMVISVARSELTLRSVAFALIGRTALIGLGSGTLFAVAAVGFQTAARSVQSDDFIVQAATTLAIGILFQSALMLVFLEKEELSRVRSAWKPSLLVGFIGATATFLWFAAFTLQEAALVKVVAQVEMLFSFAFSVFIFRESINAMDIGGCVLIVSGISCLILFG